MDDATTEAPARCGWANGEPAYLAYHDREWGRPEGNETKLLEKLCLEGFQSGLSWATILRKREGFREAFAGFEAERMAGFGEAEVERLLGNPGIVRHRAKILAAIGNARALRAMHEKGESLAALAWSFEPPPEERPAAMTADWLRANPISPRSAALSKALKAKGFAFVGPTTCYAFMQSEGIVNDHLDTCFCRAGCEAEREAFIRPK